ncbi:ROK family protein [Bariatricus sp. SGI.154]|uniref:ROK family protein n=1 Tax=Bariatricus sp. SGI.154 TaxID=3420549 RepID=UPI003D008658
MNRVDIKEVNRNRVYQLVYQQEQVSKPAIASALGISLPTASQCVNELIERNLVYEKGYFESTGGRKAAIITLNRDIKVSVGLEILKELIHLTVIDLYGTVIHEKFIPFRFNNDEAYCIRVGEYIMEFIAECRLCHDTILGVGIAIQGLVDEKTGNVTFGRILNANGFCADRIGRYVPFSCTLRHDTELAASFALWHNPAIKDALYMVLNRNLGGAVIINGEVHRGQILPSGLIAHMTLVPEGELCYCGRRGCVERYCSADSIIHAFEQELDDFFDDLRNGEPKHVAFWEQYLKYLSRAIYNYQILMSTEVVIGGVAAKYLTEEDLHKVVDMELEKSNIAERFPRISISEYNNTAAGAALIYIKEFLGQFGIRVKA